MIVTQLTPFNENIIANALDASGNPVTVGGLADLQVLILVNGITKAKYKKIAAGGWLSWTAGAGSYQVNCAVDNTLSNGWRGLAQLQIQQVNNDGSTFMQPPVILFICEKSGYTTYPSVTPNPIAFTTAFSCDDTQSLAFSCTVTAPVANYIIEIQVEDEWKRLYDGYLQVTEGNTPTVYTKTIPLNLQITAGTYNIRVKNDITGNTSDAISFYLPDCTEGARKIGSGLMGWPEWFNIYGGY